MKAVRLMGPEEVRVDDVAEPELVDNVIPMGQRRTLLELTEAHRPATSPT